METTNKKVLLVDDDQFLLNMYAMKFKNSGFEPDTASSAQAALQKLHDGNVPDLMLVDLVMPSMDGFEFIRQVKEGRLAPKAAVVVLTNQGGQADIDRAHEMKVDGYIVKATTIPSEVVEEVRSILAKKPK